MPSILEELKGRLSDSQRRVSEANQRLQQAQQAHAIAMADYNVWRAAVDAETRDELARVEAARENQPVFDGFVAPKAESTVTQADLANLDPVESATTAPPTADESINKTEIIRTLLRQNPTGLTPPQIWSQVSSQFKHRPYMYSVLKRLKDRDEISFRRNKYMIRQEPEVSEHAIVQ